MKLFRRKDKIYGEIIKYSHNTALENPDMIDREHDRKINELKKEINKLKENKKYYSFEVMWKHQSFQPGFQPRKELRLIRTDETLSIHYYAGTINFDKEKIMKFVDVDPVALLAAIKHNEGLDDKIKVLNNKLNDLLKEQKLFKKNYIGKKKITDGLYI